MSTTTPWLRAIFSPTGGTRAIADAITAGIPVNDKDLTRPGMSPESVPAETPLLAVVPVYGGRVPAAALERLATLQGHGGPAIAVVVYGNRAYEDALAELVHTLTAADYRVVAAAAFIAEHSIIRSIGAARPDAADKQAAAEFAAAVQAKLALPAAEQGMVSVPGNPEPGERKKMPLVPQTNETCGNCKRCARSCPVQAIPMGNCKLTNPNVCILCMRCIEVCPSHARSLPAEAVAGFTARLQQCASEPKTPELFL